MSQSSAIVSANASGNAAAVPEPYAIKPESGFKPLPKGEWKASKERIVELLQMEEKWKALQVKEAAAKLAKKAREEKRKAERKAGTRPPPVKRGTAAPAVDAALLKRLELLESRVASAVPLPALANSAANAGTPYNAEAHKAEPEEEEINFDEMGSDAEEDDE